MPDESLIFFMQLKNNSGVEEYTIRKPCEKRKKITSTLGRMMTPVCVDRPASIPPEPCSRVVDRVIEDTLCACVGGVGGVSHQVSTVHVFGTVYAGASAWGHTGGVCVILY